MQGRKNQGNGPRDRSSGELLTSANGSGKQRTVPQRPPGMTRVEHPPQTPRVSRPQRQSQPPKRWRRRLLILSAIFIACGLIAGAIGFGLYNYFAGAANSAGAANTAADFMLDLKSQNYDQAYNNDLDASITISLTPDAFKQMAMADDHCYGQVTDFNEEAGSAVMLADNTLSYTYDVTRSKLAKTYKLTLTLQKDPNGNWDITKYGGDLGPAPPSCQ